MWNKTQINFIANINLKHGINLCLIVMIKNNFVKL